MRQLFFPLAIIWTGCAAPAGTVHPAPLHRPREPVEPEGTAAALNDAPAETIEGGLSGPLDLRKLLGAAIERNPELREARARTRIALEEAQEAGKLDDPVFKAEAEAVPLHNPTSFDRDADNLFGFSQKFPFPGSLALRERAARLGADAEAEMARAAELDIVARLKKAYFEYFLRSKEIEIHREHVGIFERFERTATAKFRTGTVAQQDVLKAQIELVMLHDDIFAIERRLVAARAAINVLLHRPANGALGEPRAVSLSPPPDVAALQAQVLDTRPDVRALALRVEAARTSRELARRDAVLPEFMAGVDYWQVPRDDDAWGGFVSLSLPWLTGKRAATARKMGHALDAAEAALDRARNQAAFEVIDAVARLEAARKSVTLIQGELIPKADQGVEVSRVSYENDKASFLELLDAERSQREVQLKRYRALAEYESALADLEQAAGVSHEVQP